MEINSNLFSRHTKIYQKLKLGLQKLFWKFSQKLTWNSEKGGLEDDVPFKRMWFSGSSCYLSRGVAPSDRTATLQPRHLAKQKRFPSGPEPNRDLSERFLWISFFFRTFWLIMQDILYSKWKVFLGAKQSKSKFVFTIFQTSRFLVFFVAVSSLDFRGKFWGELFFVFPCESFRISDPAVPNDEILVGAWLLRVTDIWLHGKVYIITQYIAYIEGSFINEYSITITLILNFTI